MGDQELKYKFRLPRIVVPDADTSANYVQSRTHMIDGTIPVYWGPKQSWVERDDTKTDDASVNEVLYSPPTDWPKAGEILAVPRVVRFAWQTADLDAEAVTVAGFSGTYTYGLHIAEFHFSDVFSGSGIFPAHVDAVYPWPQFTQGVIAYAIEQKISVNGSQTVINGTYTATGNTIDWFLWNFMTPPYSLVDYRAPNSITFGAINTAWLLLFNGFTPQSPTVPGNDQTVPQFITQTFDGFFNVGCTKPIRTGNYSIDGRMFSEPPELEIPSDPVTVPINFDRGPGIIDITVQPLNWQVVEDAINTKYKDHKHYWVTAFQRMPHSWGWIDGVSPQKTTYLAGDSLTILVLSKPDHVPDPSDWRVQRIRAAYKQFVGYNVYIFIDTGYMLDCNLSPGVIGLFTNAVSNFCNSMKDSGFHYGGAVDYKHADDMNTKVDDLIRQHMPLPDPNKTLPD